MPCIRLDTLFSDEGIESVDLLKLDVEGHEIQALEGCAATFGRGVVKRIIAEYKDAVALEKLNEHLSPLGFRRTATGLVNARFELS